MIAIPPGDLIKWTIGALLTAFFGAIGAWVIAALKKAAAEFPTKARFKEIVCEILTDEDSPFRRVMHEENEKSNDMLVTKRLDERYVLNREFNSAVGQLRREIDTLPERMARHAGNNMALPLTAVLEGIDSLRSKVDEVIAGTQKDREEP